jgi:hypothetical protein
MPETGSLEGFPPEAVTYIKDLRNEAAQYRTERNEVRAKYEEAGSLLKDANTKLTELGSLQETHEKTLTENASLADKFNRLSVAAKFGIADHADRLKGATVEELETDAKTLADTFGKQGPPRLGRDPAAGQDPNGPKVDPVIEAFKRAGVL